MSTTIVAPQPPARSPASRNDSTRVHGPVLEQSGAIVQGKRNMSALSIAQSSQSTATNGRAGEYAADAKASAEEAVADYTATTVAYMAAHGAESRAPGGFKTEREWQSRWLAERLGVSAI